MDLDLDPVFHLLALSLDALLVTTRDIYLTSTLEWFESALSYRSTDVSAIRPPTR